MSCYIISVLTTKVAHVCQLQREEKSTAHFDYYVLKTSGVLTITFVSLDISLLYNSYMDSHAQRLMPFCISVLL